MSSTQLQPCTDLTDIRTLSAPAALFLKPIARVTVAVELPKSLSSSASRSGSVGKSISNWEVMEKVRSLVKPIVFSVMKVTTSTLEVIRYEGEVENKDLLLKVIYALDNQTIKLKGFSEVLRVFCAEATLNFPQRHDWTAFFRDAQNVNELVPGHRPDTVVLQNLPCKWFADSINQSTNKSTNQSTNQSPTQSANKLTNQSANQPPTQSVNQSTNQSANQPPSQSVNQSASQSTKQFNLPSVAKVKEIFEIFGEVRALDIPVLDPCRNNASRLNGMTTNLLTLGHELVFDVFVQFSVHLSFVQCLTALYGMKLLWKESEQKAMTANVKVDFDRTQHMSDKNRRKRRQDRAEYCRLEKEKELKAKRQVEEAEERRRLEEQRLAEEARVQKEKRNEKEEFRLRRKKTKAELRRKTFEEKKQHFEEKKRRFEEKKRRFEEAVEERKLLISQRRLESFRLFSSIFDRLKEKRVIELVEQERLREEEEEARLREENKKQEFEKEINFRKMLTKKEEELRNLLLKTKKRHEEKKLKKAEEKKQKKQKRREQKTQKNISNDFFETQKTEKTQKTKKIKKTKKTEKSTPHLQRFLEDLPVLHEGPLSAGDLPFPTTFSVKETTTLLGVVVPSPSENPSLQPPKQRLESLQKTPVQKNSSFTNQNSSFTTQQNLPLLPGALKRRPSAVPQKTHMVGEEEERKQGEEEERKRKREREEESVFRRDDAKNGNIVLKNIVVVVPSSERGQKEPLFTTPKNILYC